MQHGDKSFEITAPRSRFYQGGFGRLFPDLPPWKPELKLPADGQLGEGLIEEAMKKIALERMVEEGPPAGKNADIPSGYTYFGQFVDHDITFDITPLSEADADPNRLRNFRTPRLDLDSLYGSGPTAQPSLYEFNAGKFSGKFRIGSLPDGKFDLPRISTDPGASQTAIIGDPRNEENVIVAQIHLAFLKAHNSIVDHLVTKGRAARDAFDEARRVLRWLYQWIVWNDFLKRVLDKDVHRHALQQDAGGVGRCFWKSGYDDVFNWKNSPFMPVEFSGAAYRFGHSLVRGAYATNAGNSRGETPGNRNFVPTFAVPTPGDPAISLAGKRALSSATLIQWDWYLKMPTSAEFPGFPQPARAFDTKLVRALRVLPDDEDAPGDETRILSVLAARNLARGYSLQLPTGSSVAKLLGAEVLDLEDGEPDALWYYILKEAEVRADGKNLGQVGSIIVGATFAGLLLGDNQSYLRIEPNWTPDGDEVLAGLNKDGSLTADGKAEGVSDWTLASIIRLSKVPVRSSDFGVPAPAAGSP